METVCSLSDGDALPTHLFALIVMLEATQQKRNQIKSNNVYNRVNIHDFNNKTAGEKSGDAPCEGQ